MALDERHYSPHPITKIAVNRMVHALLHRIPTAYREEHDDDRQAQKIPGSEANMDRQTLQFDPSRML